MAQSIFKRYEKKYLMDRDKYYIFKSLINDKVVPDMYSNYTISNIYYDTDNYDLIRSSIEKPPYKEKLRMRSYGLSDKDDKVFLELKKKYSGIVYKRREILPYKNALELINGKQYIESNQILNEIKFFLDQNKVSGKVFLGYDREAFSGRVDDELRITFDTNIRFRENHLSFLSGTWGKPLLDDDTVLMEIKVPGVFPMWLSSILSELEIFPVSFSKYGTCYKNHIVRKMKVTNIYTEVPTSA